MRKSERSGRTRTALSFGDVLAPFMEKAFNDPYKNGKQLISGQILQYFNGLRLRRAMKNSLMPKFL